MRGEKTKKMCEVKIHLSHLLIREITKNCNVGIPQKKKKLLGMSSSKCRLARRKPRIFVLSV